MTPFRYAPSIQQLVTVNNLVRFGRKIVANGNTFTPDEAVEFRVLMNRAVRDFELPDPSPCVDIIAIHEETMAALKRWIDTPEQSAVRSEMEAQ